MSYGRHGYCPECGAQNKDPGDGRAKLAECVFGHRFPSRDILSEPPAVVARYQRGALD